MLEGLFTRLGSQFREGGLIHAKFLVQAGPTFVHKATRPNSSFRKLKLEKDGGAGLLKLTLEGGAREIALLAAHYVNAVDAGDVTDHLRLNPRGAIDEKAGTVLLTAITGDGVEAAADPAVGDEIHVSLYAAR